MGKFDWDGPVPNWTFGLILLLLVGMRAIFKILQETERQQTQNRTFLPSWNDLDDEDASYIALFYAIVVGYLYFEQGKSLGMAILLGLLPGIGLGSLLLFLFQLFVRACAWALRNARR